MILDPVTVGATEPEVVCSAIDAARGKAVLVQNPTGGDAVALKFDGGAETLTFANGMLLEPGTERVVEMHKGSFHNAILGICDTGNSATLRVHVIE